MRDAARFVPAALLGIGCLLISGMREQHRVPPLAPVASMRLDVPGYRTQDVVVPEEERRIAGMSDYVMRVFERDSLDQFSVYVGYYDYQVQGKSIHSPKNCLPGAGWETVDAGVRTLRADGQPFVVNRYLLAKDGARAMVYYWYQGRGRVEASEYRVKWNLLRDAALYGRTEESLVRIVVPVVVQPGSGPADLARAQGVADSLATSVAVRLKPAVARVIPAAPSTS